jgi:hypothetical protein
MKRSIDRSKRLPAFQVDLPALKLFAGDVARVFAGTKPSMRICLSLRGEKLEFVDIEELELHGPELPGRVSGFEMSWLDYGNDRNCRLGSSIGGSGMVYASAPDEAWCAGVIAVVEKHARANRKWWAFLRSWHVWLCTMVLAVLPSLAKWIFHRTSPITEAFFVAWFVLLVLSWVLWFRFERLFPPRTLLIRAHEKWFRRHETELTLALALVSLVVSLVALFIRH